GSGQDLQRAAAGDGEAAADPGRDGEGLALLDAVGAEVELDARAAGGGGHEARCGEGHEQERDAGDVERRDREGGREQAHGCAEDAELNASAHSAGTAARTSSTISPRAVSG